MKHLVHAHGREPDSPRGAETEIELIRALVRVIDLRDINHEPLRAVNPELERVRPKFRGDVNLRGWVVADLLVPSVTADARVRASDLDAELIARRVGVGEGHRELGELRVERLVGR